MVTSPVSLRLSPLNHHSHHDGNDPYEQYHSYVDVGQRRFYFLQVTAILDCNHNTLTVCKQRTICLASTCSICMHVNAHAMGRTRAQGQFWVILDRTRVARDMPETGPRPFSQIRRSGEFCAFVDFNDFFICIAFHMT